MSEQPEPQGVMHAGAPDLRQLAHSLFLAKGIIIPQEVIVPDISFYQVTADFEQMKRNGARGVIIRAGQNTWPDTKFSQFWGGAKAAGLPRGTYWYYDSRTKPATQADLYYQQFSGDMPEMEIIADYEESYGGAYGGWQNLKAFLERLHARGVPYSKIVIYTGYYYWRSNSPQSSPLELLYFEQFKLHLAWYTTNPGGVSIPAPWTNDDLLFWQFTDKGPGAAYGVESGNIDLNYFGGTAAEFDARYGGGTTPPVPPEPPQEPKQKGTVLVTALNVRDGPSTDYPVINGLLHNDVAYGNVDPATNWMRIARVLRTDGSLDVLDGWASAYPQYMQVEAIDAPAPGGDDMETIVYSNGVEISTGRQFDSDVQVVKIPKESILKARYVLESGGALVTAISGDIVSNFTPFNTINFKPNLGLRIGGVEKEPYHDYNPYLGWLGDDAAVLTHVKRQFKNYAECSQGFRYVIEHGEKYHSPTPDWDELEPRQFVGKTPAGHTVIISAKGRSTGQRGLTLHEGAEIGLQYGCDYMMDVDSGSSVQTMTRFLDGTTEVFSGVTTLSPVPVFLSIALNEPLNSGGSTPPLPTTRRMLEYENDVLVETWVPEA